MAHTAIPAVPVCALRSKRFGEAKPRLRPRPRRRGRPRKKPGNEEPEEKRLTADSEIWNPLPLGTAARLSLLSAFATLPPTHSHSEDPPLLVGLFPLIRFMVAPCPYVIDLSGEERSGLLAPPSLRSRGVMARDASWRPFIQRMICATRNEVMER